MAGARVAPAVSQRRRPDEQGPSARRSGERSTHWAHDERPSEGGAAREDLPRGATLPRPHRPHVGRVRAGVSRCRADAPEGRAQHPLRRSRRRRLRMVEHVRRSRSTRRTSRSSPTTASATSTSTRRRSARRRARACSRAAITTRSGWRTSPSSPTGYPGYNGRQPKDKAAIGVDAPRVRLHVVRARQVAQHGVGGDRRRAARTTAGRAARSSASIGSTASSAATRTSGTRSSTSIASRSTSRACPRRATTSPKTSPTGR